MYGQSKLTGIIDGHTLKTFPKTLMLLGEKGSGKHTLCEYVSKKLQIDRQDITSALSQELLDDIMTRVHPYLYIIDGPQLTIKQENSILKFLEEPLKNSYVVILYENTIQSIPTIISRCQIWELEKYTKQDLLHIFPTSSDTCLALANTPGQIQEYESLPILDMFALANKIIDKIGVANFSNTLSLSDKMKFKQDDDANKYDIKLFFKILLACLNQKIISDKDVKYVHIYNLTSKYIQDLNTRNCDTKSLFENYLVKLRFLCR